MGRAGKGRDSPRHGRPCQCCLGPLGQSRTETRVAVVELAVTGTTRLVPRFPLYQRRADTGRGAGDLAPAGTDTRPTRSGNAPAWLSGLHDFRRVAGFQ